MVFFLSVRSFVLALRSVGRFSSYIAGCGALECNTAAHVFCSCFFRLLVLVVFVILNVRMQFVFRFKSAFAVDWITVGQSIFAPFEIAVAVNNCGVQFSFPFVQDNILPFEPKCVVWLVPLADVDFSGYLVWHLVLVFLCAPRFFPLHFSLCTIQVVVEKKKNCFAS